MKLSHFILLVCFFPAFASAQWIDPKLVAGDTSQIHRVRTRLGEDFVGLVVSIQDKEVQFLFNQDITLRFAFEDIASIRVLDPKDVKKDFEYDPVRREYSLLEGPGPGMESVYYAPTAFNLAKGEGEYRNHFIFSNSMDYGLTDKISIGGGLTSVILINALQLRARFRIPISEKFAFGAHWNSVFVSFLFEETFSLHAPSVAATLGTRDQFLNLTAAFGFYLNNGDFQGTPLVALNGSQRVSRTWQLSGEVVTAPALSAYMMTLGGTWSKKKNRLNLGLSVLGSSGLFTTAPFLGYGRRF